MIVKSAIAQLCWSHPGTYLGEVAVLLKNPACLNDANENEILISILAGPHGEGLIIKINNVEIIKPSSEVYSRNFFNLSHPTHFTATLESEEFIITWQNSDEFFESTNFDVRTITNKDRDFYSKTNS